MFPVSLRIASLALFLSGAILCQPKIESVMNAASFQPGLPYGGGLATVFVSGVKNIAPGTYLPQAGQPLPFSLVSLSIEVNFARAPLLAVVVPQASGIIQVNFQVPSERNSALADQSATGSLEVFSAITGLAVVGLVTPLPAAPYDGGFFSDSNGFAAAQHASDYSAVTSANPAHPGETIIVYGTDLFPTWPPIPIGIPTPASPLFPFSRDLAGTDTIALPDPGSLFLLNQPPTKACPSAAAGLMELYRGATPGFVGVEQVNFVVPQNLTPGDYYLYYQSTINCPGPLIDPGPSVKLHVR
jgi:uncharacterized protein (TIGR03437 family)